MLILLFFLCDGEHWQLEIKFSHFYGILLREVGGQDLVADNNKHRWFMKLKPSDYTLKDDVQSSLTARLDFLKESVAKPSLYSVRISMKIS